MVIWLSFKGGVNRFSKRLEPAVRVRFGPLGTGIVGLFKYSHEDSKGRLDRTRRGGSCGAPSTDIGRQLERVWTSPSPRAIAVSLEDPTRLRLGRVMRSVDGRLL
jgi:hypothetical protein